MIPQFDSNGNLPPGIHQATIEEVEGKFAYNRHRQKLFNGLVKAIESLKLAGCKKVFLDGSFITNKKFPSDFDGCYDETTIDLEILDRVFFLAFDPKRIAQKKKFGGELFPSCLPAVNFPCTTFLDFFQRDKDNKVKGIILINL